MVPANEGRAAKGCIGEPWTWSENRGANAVMRGSGVARQSEGGSSSCLWLIVSMVALSWDPTTAFAQQDRGMISEREFNQLVFRESDRGLARKQLELKLDRHLWTLDQLCQLTEAQQQKLWLAGQGDIKRFFDRVSVVERQLEMSGAAREELNARRFLPVEQLRREFIADLFDDVSLFQKVVDRTLTPAQVARMERREQEQSDPQFYSAVRSYLLSTTRTLDLSAAQSDALEALLVESLPRTGMGTQYKNYLVAYRVSKIPEEQFAEILEEPQLEALQSALSHARALEPFLRRQGWVEDEDHDESKGDR